MRLILCDECGINFSIPEVMVNPWIENRKRFFCPNGHGMSYKIEDKKDETKILKTKIINLEAKLVKETERADALQLELEIYKPVSIEK